MLAIVTKKDMPVYRDSRRENSDGARIRIRTKSDTFGYSRGCLANERVAKRSATRWSTRKWRRDRTVSRWLFLHHEIRRDFAPAAAAGVKVGS